MTSTSTVRPCSTAMPRRQDDIYYFSIACSNTHRDPLTGHYLPNAA